MDDGPVDDLLSPEELEHARLPLTVFLDSPAGTWMFLSALPVGIVGIVLVSTSHYGSFEQAYRLTKAGMAVVVPLVLPAFLLVATYPLTRGRSRESLRPLRAWLVLLPLAVFWVLMSGWEWPPLWLVALWLFIGWAATGGGFWDELMDKADRRMKLDRPQHPLGAHDWRRLAVYLLLWWVLWAVAPPVYVWWILNGGSG